MEKSPDAFRTISEVAEDLDIPQHVLRFWETRFTQIRPLKRGGGRRYYRPDDVDLLRGIRRLLYGEGYTIRGVQRILKEEGPSHVQRIACGEIGVARAVDEQNDTAYAPEENSSGFSDPQDGHNEEQGSSRLHAGLFHGDLVAKERQILETLLHDLEDSARLLNQALNPVF
jgi:DNA-binding transcriptional MerR regulator